MKANRDSLGQSGEELAARYLQHKGLTIHDKRVRLHGGEVDIIARDGDEWVFVEVRTRTGARMGSPEESFTRAKAGRMARAVREYIHAHGLENEPIRCDFVAVDMQDGVPEIRHYPAAVIGQGLA